MRKVSNEIMTGIMVILCACLLVFFMYKTGKIGMKKDTYELKAIFNMASGIEVNAPVMLAGVEVGKVKQIDLTYGDKTSVILTLDVEAKAKVRTDSEASISTLGLMGEKYVEISAGASKEPYLVPGSTITGEEPFQFEKLAKKGEEIADNLNATLGDVRKFVNNLDGVVIDNKTGVNNMITDLEATAKNFKEFSEDIKNHPWKLLMKGKEEKKPQPVEDKNPEKSSSNKGRLH
ncbi:MAG: hypothetical protein COS99_02980 [Candidatus Omnitrophica bacterium CG07_land_8_20_14_0_80_42_15]|uniref:Mce/MlaD domain-containing protein n=1 Tax=Candidatus Aquitaenariimonas noxiae TaxID=1974741 RepID=A0A2J0KTU3_9BACT|nr:MAG: hypothetical protein COS99_02980 [Candidatus Omnitrophica bacterium CG07_land_8_20_14_0_80_42_15]